MLKEMGYARNSRSFVGAANVRYPSAGYSGIIMPLDHEKLHAIGECFLCYWHTLRVRRPRAGESA